MAYQPIENYGIIGNLHTVALVALNGSIDWLCFPRFDSPSLFGAILDDKIGGRFSITPIADDLTSKQFYWPDTNVLVTRFFCSDGVAEIIDFMPVGRGAERQGEHQLIRHLNVVRGSMKFKVHCQPAFNYARDKHSVEINDQGAIFHSDGMTVCLSTTAPLKKDGSGVRSRFTLKEQEKAPFVLSDITEQESGGQPLSDEESDELFRQTVDFWRDWLSNCTYTGRWREIVYRSVLTLKLLTYEPTGAIVASPTCSLPESIGGERNWDYRYTWIRDAAFTVYALLRVGFTEEAAGFMHWLEDRYTHLREDGSLNIMYGLDGKSDLKEETLDHLDGYRGSKPVRIGNDAFHQLQLDIYGELMDSIYLYDKYGTQISYDMWSSLRKFIDYVSENWQREDDGIWEVRSGRKHYVYSKLMCWVALDRAVRMARKRSLPADSARWSTVRNEIYETIMKKGWNKDRKAFVQYFGSQSLDAANLIMPLVFYVAPTDPRMISTIDEVLKSPQNGGLTSNSLVHRYNVNESADGFHSQEGTFNMCTFWLVEALTRAGRLDESRLLFEKMHGFANHLGLYSEETGSSGEALGNFPQAFTHVALVSAAFNLDRALESGRRHR